MSHGCSDYGRNFTDVLTQLHLKNKKQKTTCNLSSSPKMHRPRRRTDALTVVFSLCSTVFLVPLPVLCITVNTPAELHASKGDTVTLSCTFTSTRTPTSKMMVDWSYRPQTGGPPQTFFHFSSRAFPPLDGQFTGRIQWQGSPARGDASIALINSTLQDNGTYTCSVRNPPDVHGSPTSHTVLTVTPKAPSIRFSDVAVLLAFILLPSAAITLFLIGQMICPKKPTKAYRSPIEVTEGEEYVLQSQGDKVKRTSCCDIYMMDSEDEDEYYNPKKRPLDEGYAESQF